MSDLYSNDKVRELSEKLVRDEVVYCVSSLISDLYKLSFSSSEASGILSLDQDDLQNLMEITDYEEPTLNAIDGWDTAELVEYLNGQDVEFKVDDEGDVLRKLARQAAEEQGFEDFCNDHNIDPDRDEVYEHWIVTEWLQRKLAEKGHPTGEVCGLTIWGRPTTGQAISMDGVMLAIANDLLKCRE